MAAASSSQIASDDRTIRDDCFASKDDVLRPSDNRLARHLVSSVLKKPARTGKCDKAQHISHTNELAITAWTWHSIRTVSMYSLRE